MELLADSFREKVGRPQDGETPSVCIVRWAACKGVLKVDPALDLEPGDNKLRIRFRASQRKYELPALARSTCPAQNCVEVTRLELGQHGSHDLNQQTLRILEPRLRNPKVLVELLKKELGVACAAPKDAKSARE